MGLKTSSVYTDEPAFPRRRALQRLKGSAPSRTARRQNVPAQRLTLRARIGIEKRSGLPTAPDKVPRATSSSHSPSGVRASALGWSVARVGFAPASQVHFALSRLRATSDSDTR